MAPLVKLALAMVVVVRLVATNRQTNRQTGRQGCNGCSGKRYLIVTGHKVPPTNNNEPGDQAHERTRGESCSSVSGIGVIVLLVLLRDTDAQRFGTCWASHPKQQQYPQRQSTTIPDIVQPMGYSPDCVS